MAPKKNKSKIEDEVVANLSTGWRKSKMSQVAVQELENISLLQSQAIIQWRAGEGEDYPFEGTLETVIFRDFVERGLAIPVFEFFHALLQFWGIQLHHLTPQSILHLSYLLISAKHSLVSFPTSILSNISLPLYPFQMLSNLLSSADVN